MTEERTVKCSKCGHLGPESGFRVGHDFFQNPYIAGCPKCDNRQSPGDASMRMFGGERPFVYVRQQPVDADAASQVMRRAGEAS